MGTTDFDPDSGAYAGTQVIYDMPAKAYHSDADGPRLSQSLATICVQKTPLHAWQAHPLLGAAPYVYEPSTDDGTLIHSLVLEPDSGDIEELDPSTIKTKDGKPAKSPLATEEGKTLVASAMARGKIPILSDKLGIYQYKATAARSRLADQGIEFTGRSEVVIYWTEETPHGPVRCRLRLDHLIVTPDRITIIDLKSTESANPRDIMATAWRFGYDIQEAAYTRGVAAAFPDYIGRIDMVFAFIELEKPYAANPITLSGEFKRFGEIRWDRGRDRWAECMKNDRWTCYSAATVEPPPWATVDEEIGS